MYVRVVPPEPSMIFEHWIHTDGSFTFQPQGAKLIVENGESANLCCKIEAVAWEEAMQKYHSHMGWKPYSAIPGSAN